MARTSASGVRGGGVRPGEIPFGGATTGSAGGPDRRRSRAWSWAELVPELEALVGEQPLRERLRELLMLALYRSAGKRTRWSATPTPDGR